MRALAVVALVAVTAVGAPRPGRFERTNSRTEQGRNTRGLLGDSLAWLEAFPASGAGLPTAANLCDTLTAAELSGGFCLHGDGTLQAGSSLMQVDGGTDTLTAVGSPSGLVTETVCPSGPNCATLSTLRFNNVGGAGGGQWMYASSGSILPPSGAWSMCFLIKPTFQTAGEVFAIADTAALWDTLLELNSTRLDFYTNATIRSQMTGLTQYAWHLACFTGNAAQTAGVAYLDGSVFGALTTSAAMGTTARRWAVGGIAGNNYAITKSSLRGAFVLKGTQLDASRIAAIARAVLADAPTGARGEALSETRASVQFCESSDGTGSLLPNNRLCVTRGGTTAAQGSFVQSLLQTEALGNAAWADVATPTITSDSTVSAGGTLTADTIDDHNAAAFEGRSQSVTVTAAAAYTMSCYAKAGTLAKIRLSLDGTTGDTTTLSSSSWTRVSVTDVSTSGVSVSAQVLAGTATTDTGTIHVWGCNVTPGSSLRPYIPATSAAVTTAAEVPYFTLTNAPALNSIEVTVDTPASFTGKTILTATKDASNFVQLYVPTGKLGCFYYVGAVGYEGQSAGSIPANALGVRLSCSYDGTNVIACVNGTCTSTAKTFTNIVGMTKLYVGSYSSTGFEFNPTPVIKSVKADTNGARFR